MIESFNECIVCGEKKFTAAPVIAGWVCDECFQREVGKNCEEENLQMPFFSEQEKKAKTLHGVDVKMGSIDEFFGNYLKSEHITQDLVVTVKEVKVEFVGQENSQERKLVVYFTGLPQELADKGLALNKINAEAISELANSRDYGKWAGLRLCLYVDPNVMYGGKRVGGIRVRVPSQGVREQ